MIREYADSDKPEVLNLLLSNMPKYFDPEEVKDFEEYLDVKREKLVGVCGSRCNCPCGCLINGKLARGNPQPGGIS
jgi:hypothetical protein